MNRLRIGNIIPQIISGARMPVFQSQRSAVEESPQSKDRKRNDKSWFLPLTLVGLPTMCAFSMGYREAVSNGLQAYEPILQAIFGGAIVGGIMDAFLLVAIIGFTAGPRGNRTF